MSTGENNTSAGPNDPNQGSTLYFDPSTDEKAMATLRELELGRHQPSTTSNSH